MAEPEPSVSGDASPYIGAKSKIEPHSPRVISYGALALALLLSMALTWMLRDLHPTEVPSWKAVFALAEVARERGDLYDANALYAHAGKLAAWREDWAGLLVTACRLDKLEKKRSRYSARDALLLRAITAAEKKQSRAGMTAVAKAFTLLGEHELASAALSRVRKNWSLEDDEPSDGSSYCWESTSAKGD